MENKYTNTSELDVTKKIAYKDADAMLKFAHATFWGEETSEVDPFAGEAAYGFLTKLAEQEDSGAMNLLGALYYEGRYVKQDYTTAAQWYIKAAEGCDSLAMSNAGYCFFYGNGVERDYEKAFGYFSKAAALGEYDAINKLGDMYRDGLGVKEDKKMAFSLYAHGFDIIPHTLEQDAWPANLLRLGECLMNGWGCGTDMLTGIKMVTDARNMFEEQVNSGRGIYAASGVDKADRLLSADNLTVTQLAGKTGVKPEEIPLEDSRVIALLNSEDAAIIPKLDSDEAVTALELVQPETFEDLVRVIGIINSDTELEYDEKRNFVFREDIYNKLLEFGLEAEDARKITEDVRKGKVTDIFPDWKEDDRKMREKDVPVWFIEMCWDIRYLPSYEREYPVALRVWQLAWYSLNYPEETKSVLMESKRYPHGREYSCSSNGFAIYKTPDSTCFREVGYNISANSMYLKFRETGVSVVVHDVKYIYFDDFMVSDSLGRYFNKHIKNDYRCETVFGI